MKQLFTIAILLLGSLSSYAQFSFENYAITHVNVVDVLNKQLLQDQTIVIYKDRITAIVNSANYVGADSVQTINLTGKYVIPGLIDAHVHFATDPSIERRDNAEKILKEMLLSGITAVRDMAGDARALSSLSRDALIDDIVAPNLYYSALMAGPEFFTDPRTLAGAQGGESGKMPYLKGIDSLSNIGLEVAQAKGTGAHGIKLYAQLKPELLNRIVAEAKKQEIPVWSHAGLQKSSPSEVFSSGVISVSHAHMLLRESYWGDKDLRDKWKNHEPGDSDKAFWDAEFEKLDFQDLYRLLKEHNVVLDATVTIFDNYKDNPKTKWVYEIGNRIVAQAYQNGVAIAAGSDSDQKTFVQYEMKLLAENCGFDNMDAIIAGSIHAAMATAIAKDQGSVTEGKKANLVVLNANPLEELDNVRDVFLVMKNGKLYNSK